MKHLSEFQKRTQSVSIIRAIIVDNEFKAVQLFDIIHPFVLSIARPLARMK
jgi:hypothetical protein